MARSISPSPSSSPPDAPHQQRLPAARIDGTGTGADSAEGGAKKKRSILNRIWDFYDYLHLKIHLLWIALFVWTNNLSSQQSYIPALVKYGPSSKKPNVRRRHRAVVIIGDDYARGVGDWVHMGVTCVPGLLRYQKWPLKTLLLKWDVFSATKVGSTSGDWLPAFNARSEEPDGGGDFNDGTPCLFEQAFHPSRGVHRTADIVVVAVGTLDRCATDVTARNVVAIARALESRGKRVVVAPPLIPPHTRQEGTVKNPKRFTDRSRAVSAAIEKVWPRPELASTMVKVGRRTDETLHNEAYWRFGGRYPSGAGYKVWGSAWMDVMLLTAKAVEAPVYLQIAEQMEPPAGQSSK